MDYKEINLTDTQASILAKVMKNYRRFYILNWARRSGKNFIDIVIMIQIAIAKPGTRSLMVAKTNKSARVTAYEVAVAMLSDQWGDSFYKTHGTNLEIRLANGSVLSFGSSTEPDAFRGQEVDGILICDEIDFWGSASGSNFEQMFEEVLRPLTSVTMCPILITSTPKGVGMPLHKWWLKGQRTSDRFFLSHVTAEQAGIIPLQELLDAKADMNPDKYREEYMAEFVSASSRVYAHFGEGNVVKGIEDRQVELYVGLDHNVGQSTAIIGQMDGKSNFEVIDELMLTNSNTREMAISIKARYPNRNITIFPDPSGKARKTSAEIGVTDHSILKEEGLTVVAPNKAPLVVDRINTVNNLVYTADGNRRLFVDSKCETLIEAMNYHLYDEKKGQPQKGGADRFDDTNDSLGYLLWGLFGGELSGVEKGQFIKTPRFFG